MKLFLRAAALLLSLSPFTAAQTTHDVTLSGLSFSPSSLTIDVGDTVKWTWLDGLHDVVSGVGGAPDFKFLSGPPTSVPGTTFSVTFDQAFLDANPASGNNYPYFCSIHITFGMVGDITVNVPAAVTVYGSGINPAGSMTHVSGLPTLGGSFTVGVDNPTGTQAAGSFTFLQLARKADVNFPAGTPIPGFGMSGPGAVGELLIDLSKTLGPPRVGPLFAGAGTPANISVNIPNNPSLMGKGFFGQGAIFDPVAAGGVQLGITDGVQFTIGV